MGGGEFCLLVDLAGWLVQQFSLAQKKKNHTASPGARRSGKKSCRSCSYFPALGSFGSSSPLTEPGIYCHYSNSSGKFLVPILAYSVMLAWEASQVEQDRLRSQQGRAARALPAGQPLSLGCLETTEAPKAEKLVNKI